MNVKLLSVLALMCLLVSTTACDKPEATPTATEATTAEGATLEATGEAAAVEPGAAAAEGESDSKEGLVASKVMLFTDFRKSESSCGCGQLIRLIRMTAERGVSVEEVDKNGNPDKTSQYAINTDPTVIFLDANGEVVHRFEGEAEETLETIRERVRELVERS